MSSPAAPLLGENTWENTTTKTIRIPSLPPPKQAAATSLSTTASQVWSRLTARKPLSVILAEDQEGHLDRSLELTDLLAIGIGGTVGSGIFVTTGLIAHMYAGPAVVLSWLVGGVGCAISGLSYAEMSSKIPSAGSTYAYTYHTMGELPAFVAGGLLTLEYGVSGAAVARSWGDKFAYTAATSFGMHDTTWMNSPSGSLMAGLIQAACVLLLLGGLSLGTKLIKAATATKVVLVVFMIVAGFALFDSSLLSPLIPPAHMFEPNDDDSSAAFLSFGFGGVISGATQAFFGFVGFDEAPMAQSHRLRTDRAAQTRNARANMPKAVLGTILGVTILSSLASLALVGMVSYSEISGSSGFASAFDQRGLGWAAAIVEFGELLTLPVVVLIAFLAQPQLFFAMAQDGLMPAIFAKTDDKTKTLVWGTAIAGVLMVLVAVFVPFTSLGDMISAGVLVSFNMTNAALLLCRLREAGEGGSDDAEMQHLTRPLPPSPTSKERVGTAALASYALFTTISAFLWQYSSAMDSQWGSTGGVAVSTAVFSTVLAALCLGLLTSCFPQNGTGGGGAEDGANHQQFRVPFVPLLPCAGIAFNMYLVSTISAKSLALLGAFVGAFVAMYFVYGFSASAARDKWAREHQRGAVRVLLGTGEFRTKDAWRRPRSKSV